MFGITKSNPIQYEPMDQTYALPEGALTIKHEVPNGNPLVHNSPTGSIRVLYDGAKYSIDLAVGPRSDHVVFTQAKLEEILCTSSVGNGSYSCPYDAQDTLIPLAIRYVLQNTGLEASVKAHLEHSADLIHRLLQDEDLKAKDKKK